MSAFRGWKVESARLITKLPRQGEFCRGASVIEDELSYYNLMGFRAGDHVDAGGQGDEAI